MIDLPAPVEPQLWCVSNVNDEICYERPLDACQNQSHKLFSDWAFPVIDLESSGKGGDEITCVISFLHESFHREKIFIKSKTSERKRVQPIEKK